MRSPIPIRVVCLLLAILVGCPTVGFAAEIPRNVLRAISGAVGSESSQENTELLTSVDVPADAAILAREVAPDHRTGAVRIKLSCVPANLCLPFYAIVHGVRLAVPATKKLQHLHGEPPEVRAGDHGALVTHTASMRITLPVTSLDAGHVGDVVRVRFEKRLTWRARVLAAGKFESIGEVR